MGRQDALPYVAGTRLESPQPLSPETTVPLDLVHYRSECHPQIWSKAVWLPRLALYSQPSSEDCLAGEWLALSARWALQCSGRQAVQESSARCAVHSSVSLKGISEPLVVHSPTSS